MVGKHWQNMNVLLSDSRQKDTSGRQDSGWHPSESQSGRPLRVGHLVQVHAHTCCRPAQDRGDGSAAGYKGCSFKVLKPSFPAADLQKLHHQTSSDRTTINGSLVPGFGQAAIVVSMEMREKINLEADRVRWEIPVRSARRLGLRAGKCGLLCWSQTYEARHVL